MSIDFYFGQAKLLSNLQHNRFLSDAKGKDADVIFIGDSILQALEHTEVWNQWFAPLHCLNFSIHNDQTQNVLWRIKNGELDHVEANVRLKLNPSLTTTLSSKNVTERYNVF